MSASKDFFRRFLSLWLPFLPTDRVRRQQRREQAGAPPDPLSQSQQPLALFSASEGAQRLTAVDRAATAAGLLNGMALAQARAILPDLSARPHDPASDLHLLETIADWADRYTPLVGRNPPQGLLLDITGAAHLRGGEEALSADLVCRLASQGFFAVTAIAPTVGAAWALARCARAEQRIVPEGVSRAELDVRLSGLPVHALRVAPETAAALRRVGLKRIGDLIGRPRSALAARFGASLILQLDRARGIDDEAISPRQPRPAAVVEQGFVEPILTTDAVAQGCRVLADRLGEMLDARGQGATAVELAIYRVDGLVKRVALRLASPCRDGKTMAGLLGLRLAHLDDPLDPGFGYDLIRLAATAIAAKSAVDVALPGIDDQAPALQLAEACAPLINRLAARFGSGALATIALADTHCPEQAARLVAASTNPAPVAAEIPRLGPRPLRLFDPPEPVDVIAEVPDGPPLHLRWRRRPLRIVAAHGPERIAPDWWHGPLASSPVVALTSAAHAASTRDYWRIEDSTGRRLWLYREGFYGAGPPTIAVAGRVVETPPQRPRWYVHGLFA